MEWVLVICDYLPHVSVMREVITRTEVPEKGPDRAAFVPGENINCARVDIFGYQCRDQLA